MEKDENSVKTPTDLSIKRKGDKYNDLVALNPDSIDEIEQYLRSNGITEMVKYNWTKNRTDLTSVHLVIVKNMIKDLNLITE